MLTRPAESRKEGIRCKRGASWGAGGGGDSGAGSAQGVSTADRGQAPRAERTLNMECMVVTLEVSKLSGWLKADAPCRESSEGHTMRNEVRAGGCG